MSLVLVADDEPAVLDALSQVVEDLGHRVVRAHDGSEALQLARAKRPSLVVTDLMMPQLSGLDLVKQLQADEQLRDVPVLLLSASSSAGGHPAAHVFLPKPFELAEFEKLVASLLSGAAGQEGGDRPPPGEPPEAPEERLRWAAAGLAAPLSLMRGRLEELRRGMNGAASEPVRRELGELERAVDEMERIIRRVAPPGH